MRKIIDGKTYNTATSKCIGSWTNGLFCSDFEYCAEDLYKNTKGAYFLYGHGGGNSKYGEWHGNSGGPGSVIVPMTTAEAQAWAEEHLDADDYNAEFGDLEEAAPSDLTTRERVNLTLDTEIITALRKLSAETNVPMARMVDRAIMAMYGEQFRGL